MEQTCKILRLYANFAKVAKMHIKTMPTLLDTMLSHQIKVCAEVQQFYKSSQKKLAF